MEGEIIHPKGIWVHLEDIPVLSHRQVLYIETPPEELPVPEVFISKGIDRRCLRGDYVTPPPVHKRGCNL